MLSEDSALMRRIAALPKEPTRKLDHLPSDNGLPFIGRTLDLVRRPVELVEEQRRRYGPVFQTTMYGRKIVTFAEPDAAELILMDREQNFSSALGWVRMRALFDRGILLRDFHSHRIHRRPLQAAFKSANMRSYADKLNQLIASQITDWDQLSNFHFQPEIKKLLLDNAAAIFLGAQLGQESDKLNQSFVALLDGVLALARVDLPGFTWRRSMKGKRFLTEWLHKEHGNRLHSDSNDFFTSLCQAAEDPEHAMSAQEVVEHTLLILFAAHDTTTGTLSAMFSLLCEYPEWQEKLREECLSLDQESLGFDDLQKLELCDWVLNETLRLHPAVFVIPRRSINEFEYKGHRIPANTAIMLQSHLIHHDENYWSNPKQFDPERWSNERKEHKNHPFQYIPFGAGAHKCLGFRFAELQSKIFIFNFLRKFRISSRPGRKHDMLAVPIPAPRDRLPAIIEPL